MKQAVIFSLENSNNEPNYEKLSLLLSKSLKDTNADVDVYCGIFTDRQPSKSVLDLLTENGTTIINDIRFRVEENSINYFLRNYCCYYFSHVVNLLEKYDRLIYLDIDVLVLSSLDEIDIPDNAVIVEQVPENILKFEKSYIGTVDYPLYYNWYSIINKTNKHIYDIDYINNTYLKESDKLVSQNINNSKLDIIHQTVGAYYPKHALNSNTVLFHYDGFIDSGNFYKLEDYDQPLYRKYFAYAAHVLNIKQENDKSFWNDI